MGLSEAGASSQVLTLLSDRSLRLIEMLNPVFEASWNSSAREYAEGCLEGTRVAVFSAIEEWYKRPSTPILWLNGNADTGKTTTAHSICESFEKKKVLGGSFFFSRSDDARNKTNCLIRTLAHQLSNSFPGLRGPISEALKDSSLLRSSTARQFQELIVRPIEGTSSTLTSPILFVVDAIDECEGEEQEISVLHIITLLSNKLSMTSASIKILVTGRPRRHVVAAFSQPSVALQSGIFVLHEMVDMDLDVRLYISSKLHVIATTHYRGFDTRGWPSKPEMDALVAAPGGTAATLRALMIKGGSTPLK